MSESNYHPIKTVYIVGDHALMLNSLMPLLLKHQYRVLAFSSAEELLESGIDTSALCLLVAETLPGLPGIELIETLNHQGVRIPAIVFSQQSSVKNAVRAMKAKALDYMEVPVSPSVLVNKIIKIAE